jgi:hypothetical protein
MPKRSKQKIPFIYRLKQHFKKKITLWFVVNNDFNFLDGEEYADKECTVYSVTDTEERAKEYVNKAIFMKHLQHFVAWCYAQHINVKNPYSPSPELWSKYYNTVWAGLEKFPYRIQKETYDIEDIAAMFRIFNNSIPMGCSYETKMEIEDFISKTKAMLDKK